MNKQLLQRAKAKEMRTLRDWRRVLNLVEGRRVVWQLLLACGHRQEAFVPGDPEATAYHWGKRALGNDMEEVIRRADPQAYEQMRQEYEAELKQNQKELENVEDEDE